MAGKKEIFTADGALVQDIRELIEAARGKIASTVNAAITLLYWRIGRRINQEILKDSRAQYGKGILATLSQELTQQFGSGFSYSALTRMVKFYESFQDEKIVATLSQQLSDLEDAILHELEQFLLELGAGFSFIARQKRIQVDNDDYYIDLLFFNRKLKRLLAIDLKLGDFKPADKGQMELYLRCLDKYERQADELPPIGLVLCAGKKRETVELLALENSGIRVAEYMTELPPRKVLEQKLHAAIEQARKAFDNRRELTAGNNDDEPTR